jgi:GTP cyclohydrolase I
MKTDPYPPYDRISSEAAQKALELLQEVGIHCNTEHTEMTPYRLIRYLTYLIQFPAPETFHLTTFKNEDPHITDLQVVPNIDFWSACSHHCLPFIGQASIGYIPGARLVGLSKIALLVRSLARGYWMQEHLAQVIADNLETSLQPQGVAVYLRAMHTCQLLDLGQPPIPIFKSTVLRGVLMHGPAARDEFYRMVQGGPYDRA